MSEKRQFKIYSSRHIIDGENKYLLLFDILDNMETYDTEVLNKELKIIQKNTRFLKADMNYLYQLILKSLVLFHSGKSAQIILNEYLSVIEILYYKGLYIQCLKEIHKASSLARQTELFSSLIKFLQYERMANSHHQEQPRSDEEIIREMISVNKTQQIIIAYHDLHNQANQIRVKLTKTRNIRELEAFDHLISHPLIKNKTTDNSLDAKIKLYQIYAMWYYVHGNKKEELSNNKKIISLFESNQLYTEEHLVEYINTYSRILSISKDMPEKIFFQELSHVRNIVIPADKLYFMRLSAQVFNFSYSTELSMYLLKKQFKSATTIIPEIENGLKKYHNILTPSFKITFLYMLAFYYFTVGHFDNARKKINMLLNEFSENDRPDLYNFARLLNLLIHYELKNYSYIKYKRSSVLYYFKKQPSDFEIENIILKFFSKEKNYTTDIKKSLENLRISLEKSKTHSMEKYAFNYFDWLDWVTSKLDNKESISMLYE